MILSFIEKSIEMEKNEKNTEKLRLKIDVVNNILLTLLLIVSLIFGVFLI